MSAGYSRNGSRFEIAGPADAPLLAMIHGLGLNRHVWDPHRARLAQRYRVLTYDLYGHGDSAPPPAEPSLTLFAGQLIGLLDEFAIERCSLIGFSLGGMINRRLAMDYPERVASLVVLNSPHERAPEAQRLVEQRALDSASDGPGANLDATLERWFTPAFRQRETDYIEQVRGWLLANEPRAYALCRRVLAFGVVELICPEPPIRQPALVMTCEHDSGSTPEMSLSIAAEIEGAQVIIVPGLRHMGLVENPRFFVTAIDEFLETIR